MKNGRLQSKDIDDRVVLRIVDRRSREIYHPWEPHNVPHWVMRWEIEMDLGMRAPENRFGPTTTEKLVLAKCATLIRRGLLAGCPCGVTPAQRRLLERLAKGLDVISEGLETWTRAGTEGRTEKVLWRLHERGLVVWDGPIEEVTITDAGRAAIAKDKTTKGPRSPKGPRAGG